MPVAERRYRRGTDANCRQMDNHNDLRLILAHRGRVFGLSRNYDDGARAGSHSHPHGQLLYAASGIVLAETPGRLWAVPSARMLWIPPQIRHGFVTQGHTRVRTLYLPPDAVTALPLEPAALVVTPLARALLERAAETAAAANPDRLTERIVALLQDELAASRSSSESVSLALPSSRAARSFARHVTAHPDDRAPLEVLARRFGTSARTLTRRMAAETGLTAEAWRQRARLLEALARLELGEPITRVATDVGYGSPSSFGAAFRRAFGITPAQARTGRSTHA